MHPLLRRNNNLWGGIVDRDGLAPSLFVFVRKGSECFAAAVYAPWANGGAHNMPYAAAICRFPLSKGAQMFVSQNGGGPALAGWIPTRSCAHFARRLEMANAVFAAGYWFVASP